MPFHCLHKALKRGTLPAIASGAIVAVGTLTALEINKQAAAIVVTGNPDGNFSVRASVAEAYRCINQLWFHPLDQ